MATNLNKPCMSHDFQTKEQGNGIQRACNGIQMRQPLFRVCDIRYLEPPNPQPLRNVSLFVFSNEIRKNNGTMALTLEKNVLRSIFSH